MNGTGGDSVATPWQSERYLHFTRDEWAGLRAATPLMLHETDLSSLRGINERIDLDEVAGVYLPLTRLINLYVAATQQLHTASASFLGATAPKVPYVIGIAGSVAVGKSTFARILQALLARWPDHPSVDLVTTDGFLLPNRVLDERGARELRHGLDVFMPQLVIVALLQPPRAHLVAAAGAAVAVRPAALAEVGLAGFLGGEASLELDEGLGEPGAAVGHAPDTTSCAYWLQPDSPSRTNRA